MSLLQYVVDFDQEQAKSGRGGLVDMVERDPPRARRSDPQTSHKAAASVEKGLPERSRMILRALNDEDMNGSELDQHFGWLNNTAVRLLARLRRAGLIEGVGERATVTGRMAQVYRTTGKGVEVL